MTFTPAKPKLYRVYDTIGPDGLTLHFQEFTIIGETAQCWYVLPTDRLHLTQYDYPNYVAAVKKQRKRVLKDQIGRRYCYTDKRRALDSYKERKRWQRRHASLSEARADAGYQAAQRLLDGDGEINLPVTQTSEYIESLGWGEC